MREIANPNGAGISSAKVRSMAYAIRTAFIVLLVCSLHAIVSAKGLSESWRPLFNGRDLTGWTCEPGAWIVEPDGVLAAVGPGDLITNERFGDFQLDLEFKLAKLANSGVFIRIDDPGDIVQTGIEVQLCDSFGKSQPQTFDCGAIFDCLAPSKNMVKPPSEWNRLRVEARGPWILVEMNGERIIEMDLRLWTEPGKNPDGDTNKFEKAYKDMAREGHIALQYHGQPVWYRNLRVKPLGAAQPRAAEEGEISRFVADR